MIGTMPELKDPCSVRAVEAGRNEEIFACFCEENRRFILACAFRAVHRFVTESDDEWSVALSAFYEAVRTYDPGKGDFRPFAALVIRRRILDWQDRERKRMPEILTDPGKLSGVYEEDYRGSDAELIKAEMRQAETAQIPGQNPLKEEIEAAQQVFTRYGFTFFDLAECSPKAEKTKKACADAVNYLLWSQKVLDGVRKTGKLPVRELKKNAGLSPKILERHRRYIIAAAEILDGDYPSLSEYLRGIRR